MSGIADPSLWQDTGDSADLPVVRLAARGGRWQVQRAGDTELYLFDRPEQAEAFIRAQEGLPVMVELQIGELYIATRLDAGRGRLFNGPRRRG